MTQNGHSERLRWVSRIDEFIQSYWNAASTHTLEAEMHFVRFVQFAAAALVLVVGTQAGAAPIAYGTYYDEQEVSGNCNSLFSCRSNFSQLPSDKLFMLSQVNCTITASQAVTVVRVGISQTLGGNGFGRTVAVNPGPSILVAGFYYYSFETDARFLIGQGRYPFVVASVQGGLANWFMACGIVGELVTPIP